MATPLRRRFQFSFGTMLLLMTAFAFWLAWELRYIRERQAALAASKDRQSGFAMYMSAFEAQELPRAWPYPGDEPRIPFWRAWLGDRAIGIITLYDGTEVDCVRLRALFPEASEIFTAPRTQSSKY
jgi:hypothetical protein